MQKKEQFLKFHNIARKHMAFRKIGHANKNFQSSFFILKLFLFMFRPSVWLVETSVTLMCNY